MIIFGLDGTLADYEHRRHLVDALLDHPDYYRNACESCKDGSHHKIDPQFHRITKELWKPNWPAFYEACDKDKPIEPVLRQLRLWMVCESNIQIWSGRSESVREKTMDWLDHHVSCDGDYSNFESRNLKMRPIGDNTPDDELKERWLDEAIADGKTIGFVFDDRPKVVSMWRRRGIFVFNCCQHDGEF